MTTLSVARNVVTGGVDTHADVHVAAAVDHLGGVLDTASFPATASGYRRLLSWLRDHGTLGRVGVEGTGSYGAALARHLSSEQVTVVEVSCPNRQVRRRHGKTLRLVELGWLLARFPLILIGTLLLAVQFGWNSGMAEVFAVAVAVVTTAAGYRSLTDRRWLWLSVPAGAWAIGVSLRLAVYLSLVVEGHIGYVNV